MYVYTDTFIQPPISVLSSSQTTMTISFCPHKQHTHMRTLSHEHEPSNKHTHTRVSLQVLASATCTVLSR